MKGSLQNKILIPFIILVVLTGLIVSLINYFISFQNTTEELSKNVENQMVGLNDTFNLFFATTSSTLERLSLNDLVRNDPVEHEEEVNTYFAETVDTSSSMAAVYTGTADGVNGHIGRER